jgi:hypothetical protein
MTMMMIKKRALVCLALILPLAMAGQNTDNGIWYEAKAEKDIFKGLRFDLEGSIRTDQNGSHIEKFYLEPGLRYKFNDYFAAGIYYRFIEQEEDDGRYYPRHRWFIQMKGSAPEIARFTLSLRYRVQQQFKTYIEDPEDEIPEWYQRIRLELEYNIKGLPLKPYINTEMFSGLSFRNDYLADKWRSMIGIEYTLHKKHTFGIEYIYNDSRVTKPAYMNLLGITYAIKL